MLNTSMIFGLALVYAVLKIVLEKRLAPLDDVGDERDIAELAFECGCSVYDLFRSAGDQWRFSERKINADFQAYLQTNRMPSYVSAFVRNHRPNAPRTYQRLLYTGGRPPYL